MIYSILQDNSLTIAFTKPVEETNINVTVNDKVLLFHRYLQLYITVILRS